MTNDAADTPVSRAIERLRNGLRELLINYPDDPSGRDRLDGHLRSLMALVDDLADALESQAREIEDLRRELETARNNSAAFISMVSHELRIPMTSIRGYADMMDQGVAGELNENQAQFVRVILNNARRMETLVEDISDLTRIRTGRLHLKFEPVSLTDAIQQATEATQDQIAKRGHTLIVDVPDDLPTINADPKRLTQVLINLISNAYKYTPDGGTITVRGFQKGDRVYVSVADTGIGMTQEEIAHLGESFWRADNPQVISQPGTGLGFAITKLLVGLMGGEIEVESEPGVGSTFTFYVPVAGEPEEPPES